MPTDMVNHPPHYTSHPSGVECIEVVEHMSFNLGNAIKYLWRAGDKGNFQQDLDKAIWYINREKARVLSQPRESVEKDTKPSSGANPYINIPGIKSEGDTGSPLHNAVNLQYPTPTRAE